jgi:poly(3-hydroxybutyrate) depolymerase
MQLSDLLGRITSPLAGFLILAALYLLWGGRTDPPNPELPALGAKIDETSVSGISSGAYMAGQFELAHGSQVVGAAIIAGGPYGCAQSVFADMMPGPGAAMLNVAKAVNGCMLNALALWGVPNPELLAEKAARFASEGKIDPIASVRSDRVYLFSGKEDRTVVPEIVAAAADFYRQLGLPEDQLRVVSNYPAGHAFVTENEGQACDVTGKPFVVDCDYDQAGALLTHIYGKLNPPAPLPTGTFSTFDQRPFVQGMDNHGMSEIGEVYIPRDCESQSGCRVHIAFHGCAQNRGAVGEAFIKQTGFARWADTNRLIVLFPQTVVSPMNPQGCWDWWGFTSSHYMTKDAPQITAVFHMLERLGASRGAS